MLLLREDVSAKDAGVRGSIPFPDYVGIAQSVEHSRKRAGSNPAPASIGIAQVVRALHCKCSVEKKYTASIKR